MINLLPPQKKGQVALEGRWKITLILGFLILFFFVCLSLVFFSVSVFVSLQEETQKPFIEAKEQEFRSTSNQELQEKLSNLNSLLEDLDSFYQKQIDLTETIQTISQILPPGVYLTGFDFGLLTSSKKEDYRAQVSLVGFSPSRDDLLEFKGKLEEKGFKRVNFPASNWLKPEDIDFRADFKIDL